MPEHNQIEHKIDELILALNQNTKQMEELNHHLRSAEQRMNQPAKLPPELETLLKTFGNLGVKQGG